MYGFFQAQDDTFGRIDESFDESLDAWDLELADVEDTNIRAGVARENVVFQTWRRNGRRTLFSHITMQSIESLQDIIGRIKERGWPTKEVLIWTTLSIITSCPK